MIDQLFLLLIWRGRSVVKYSVNLHLCSMPQAGLVLIRSKKEFSDVFGLIQTWCLGQN